MYQDISEAPAPYQKIAVIEVSSAESKQKMLRDSQPRAAELGAS